MSEEKIVIKLKASDIAEGSLCTSGGRRCAIGHLLHVLGVPDYVMRDHATVSDIVEDLRSDVLDKIEAMGLIDRDDPEDSGRTIDTGITDDIYTASDLCSWGLLHDRMDAIGVDFTVESDDDDAPVD